MRINHNIAALNTYRQLSTNATAAQKNMAKLSSGMRINNAADDAAGLTISEKMRSQIRGLDQSARNAQDGISLIQTAEGALSETHSILDRMKELAVQSSNDTATDADRDEMQKELAQLKLEITRISTDTEFNTKKLLNGDLTAQKSAQGTKLESIALNSGGVAVATAATTTLQSLQDSSDNNLGLRGGDVINISGTKNGTSINTTFTVAGNTTVSGVLEGGVADQNSAALTNGDAIAFEYDGQVYTATIGTATVAAGGSLAQVATDLSTALNDAIGGGADITVTKSATAGASNDTLTFASGSGKDIKILATGTTTADNALKTALTTGATNDTSTHLDNLLTTVANMAGSGSTATVSGGKIEITGVAGTSNSLANIKLTATDRELFNNKLSSFRETQAAQDNHVDSSLSIHIGSNEGQTIKVDLNEMSVQSLSLGSTDISTQQGAETATSVIDNAITKVSSERSKLGGFQNRLDHTVNNLGTQSENMTTAESRIRDVDMAKEIMEFTKNNILNQAAQAMLAQANQQPQQILQLLR